MVKLGNQSLVTAPKGETHAEARIAMVDLDIRAFEARCKTLRAARGRHLKHGRGGARR